MQLESHQPTAASQIHTRAVEPPVPYVDNIHEVIKKPFVAKGPQQFAMNASNSTSLCYCSSSTCIPGGRSQSHQQRCHLAIFQPTQQPLLRLSATTVCCGQRPQHLSGHRDLICSFWPPQFVMAKGHQYLPWQTRASSHNQEVLYFCCLVLVGVAAAQGNQRATRSSILLLFNGSYNFN